MLSFALKACSGDTYTKDKNDFQGALCLYSSMAAYSAALPLQWISDDTERPVWCDKEELEDTTVKENCFYVLKGLYVSF